MPRRDVVVIGASAGGLVALKRLVKGIPADIRASLFVVVHSGADSPGLIATVLDSAGSLPARPAIEGAAFEHGVIYVAPPDRHLLVEATRMRVVRAPKENRHRPAIDPLFRSAASTCGARVIGAVLSGTLDDGAAGLWAVQASGGATVVQSPEDAEFPDMPLNAMREIDVDHCVPAEEIGPLLAQLTTETTKHNGSRGFPETLRKEAQMEGLDQDLETMNQLGELSAFTCPGCGGALWELTEGTLRYRCHTGHAFSAASLVAERSEKLEDALYSALRAMKEKVALCNRMADRLSRDHADLAAHHRQEADRVERQAQRIRELLSDPRS